MLVLAEGEQPRREDLLVLLPVVAEDAGQPGPQSGPHRLGVLTRRRRQGLQEMRRYRVSRLF